MSFSEVISPFAGRVVLAWYFAVQALNYLNHWSATVANISLHQVPLAPLVLLVAVVLLFMGALGLFLGFHTRHSAVLLFGFTAIVSVLAHDFWNMHDAARRAAEYDIFVRNLAIAGGLLILVGMGPGPFGFDSRPPKRR